MQKTFRGAKVAYWKKQKLYLKFLIPLHWGSMVKNKIYGMKILTWLTIEKAKYEFRTIFFLFFSTAFVRTLKKVTDDNM